MLAVRFSTALRDKDGLWLSLVERLVRDQEAVGSNPTSPILINCNCPGVAAAAGPSFKSDQFDSTSAVVCAVLSALACAQPIIYSAENSGRQSARPRSLHLAPESKKTAFGINACTL